MSWEIYCTCTLSMSNKRFCLSVCLSIPWLMQELDSDWLGKAGNSCHCGTLLPKKTMFKVWLKAVLHYCYKKIDQHLIWNMPRPAIIIFPSENQQYEGFFARPGVKEAICFGNGNMKHVKWPLATASWTTSLDVSAYYVRLCVFLSLSWQVYTDNIIIWTADLQTYKKLYLSLTEWVEFSSLKV